jgi:hypothetical protein
MLGWAKVATGHVDWLQDKKQRAMPVPRSISFAKMTQPEFQRFFDGALTAVLDRLLPEGTPRSSLVEEVHERAGIARKDKS